MCSTILEVFKKCFAFPILLGSLVANVQAQNCLCPLSVLFGTRPKACTIPISASEKDYRCVAFSDNNKLTNNICYAILKPNDKIASNEIVGCSLGSDPENFYEISCSKSASGKCEPSNSVRNVVTGCKYNPKKITKVDYGSFIWVTNKYGLKIKMPCENPNGCVLHGGSCENIKTNESIIGNPCLPVPLQEHDGVVIKKLCKTGNSAENSCSLLSGSSKENICSFAKTTYNSLTNSCSEYTTISSVCVGIGKPSPIKSQQTIY